MLNLTSEKHKKNIIEMARPQKYDHEDILNRMTEAFWKSGFNDLSMDDVERITNMKRGSIYNAFSDKRGLYLEALDHYGQEHYGTAANMIQSSNSPKTALRDLYAAAFNEMKGEKAQWGCFMCNAAVEIAPSDPEVAAIVAKYISKLTNALLRMLQHSAGSQTDIKQLKKSAESLTAAYVGFHVMARTGIPKASLKRIAQASIDSVWD